MYDINLLPSKLQRKINIDPKRLIILLLFVLGPAGLAGGYTFFLLNLNSLQTEINRIDQRLKQLAPQVNKVEQLKQERLKGEQQLTSLQSLIDNRFTITPILDDIAYNLPVDMWITGISAEYRENSAPRGGFASAPGLLLPEREDALPSPVESITEFQQKNFEDKNEQPAGDKQFRSPPNMLVLQGVSHSTVSIGVFVNNLSRLPYFQNVDVIKVYTATSGNPGQAFHIEARLWQVKRDVK